MSTAHRSNDNAAGGCAYAISHHRIPTRDSWPTERTVGALLFLKMLRAIRRNDGFIR